MFDMRRRSLLKGGMIVVGFTLLPQAFKALAQSDQTAKSVALDRVDGYLAIASDGVITLYSGKVDLGTGVETAMAQIAAEELDVPLTRVLVVQGDTALTPDQGTTYASVSISSGGMQVRNAAATLRRELATRAALRLRANSDELVAEDGVFTNKTSGKSVAYFELIGEQALELAVDQNVVTKSPAQFKTVGRSVPRRDIPPKIVAEFTYMQDFKLPGMLHARVVRPPSMGADLISVDETSVKDIPGLIKVVREGSFLAVVGSTEWSTISASRILKAQWSEWAGLPEQAKLWEHLRNTPVSKLEVSSNVGDAQGALASAPHVLKATYDFAIHTHGSIGPSCAVADFTDGQLTCWSASQATHGLRRQLAVMFTLKPENVRAIYLEGAGCYGRNGHEDAAADACLLAKIMGQPVRVQWMRADEHGWDPKGPPTLIDIQAGLDVEKRVIAWKSDFMVPDGKVGTVELIAAKLADMPREDYLAPGGVMGNSGIVYQFPNVLTQGHRLAHTPFRPAWIRSPGRMQNTFANECFLDEICAFKGVDPIKMRMESIDPADQRSMEVLKRISELSNWDNPQPNDRQDTEIKRGHGVAFVRYDLSRTYIAMVAEVEVERKSGKIHARKFFVVQDCGQIINPDGINNQIEGCIVQTVSRTLKEELKFDRSTVTSRDWSSYPILRFPDVPEVTISLIDRPDQPPLGVGEVAASVVCAALGNAVFNAVGARLRSIPFTEAKVLAALSAKP